MGDKIWVDVRDAVQRQQDDSEHDMRSKSAYSAHFVHSPSPGCVEGWGQTVIKFVLILTHVTCNRPIAVVYGAYADVQRAGLDALFNSTNGHEWTKSNGWNDTALGICDWYGVTCDDISRNVTALSLSNNGLKGDLSVTWELSYITSLEALDLSSNRLFGPVPLPLGSMAKLERLDFSWNELSSFPATWGSGASALRYMSVKGNRIRG